MIQIVSCYIALVGLIAGSLEAFTQINNNSPLHKYFNSSVTDAYTSLFLKQWFKPKYPYALPYWYVLLFRQYQVQELIEENQITLHGPYIHGNFHYLWNFCCTFGYDASINMPLIQLKLEYWQYMVLGLDPKLVP